MSPNKNDVEGGRVAREGRFLSVSQTDDLRYDGVVRRVDFALANRFSIGRRGFVR